MQKATASLFILSTLAAGTLILSSCNKDEPFVKPKLSMESASLTVKESDQAITVNVVLDRAYDKDISIAYSLGGTAVDKVKATSTNTAYDYEITSDYLEFEILKGETTGKIEIKLYSDFFIENTETIEISIESANDENIELTREDEIEISVEQEDGMVVLLEWGIGTGENYTDVDMDLFLWAEDATSNLALTNIFSSQASFQSPEFIFLPLALPDGSYGLSCNYYEGTEDPMNFKVSFYSIISGTDALIHSVNGAYTLNNINAWYETQVDPILVQTFEKTGGSFSNFSEITVPSSGSRVGSASGAKELVKQTQPSAHPGVIDRILRK